MSKDGKVYQLSPSDFKYLWEDCKHCYWQKTINGIELPSIGLPGIFSKMNSILQTQVLGTNAKNLHPGLPSGIFVQSEGFLKSIPIPDSNSCYISGRFDLLVKFDDGTFGIIDLKITDPKDDDVYKFSNQLHAYKFSLENPADPTKQPIKISKMGLMIISPEAVELTDGYVRFRTIPEWIEIEENMDGFFAFISEVGELLNGQTPEPSIDCKWCKYRNIFELGQKVNGEIS